MDWNFRYFAILLFEANPVSLTLETLERIAGGFSVSRPSSIARGWG
jgi:hypothetical protein